VNVYLIEDEPLTLIDAGPNSGVALDRLERELEALGYRIEDLERLFLTHQHVDHLGLARIIKERSGAEICTLDLLSPIVSDFSAYCEKEEELCYSQMVKNGVPVDVATVNRSVAQSYHGWGSATTVDLAIADGTELSFRDRTLAVFHRPGHSPSDTVLWDPDAKILLGGDHLISGVSSNPALHSPLGGKSGELGGARTHSLVNYLASLSETRQLAARTILAGHGEPITDHVALIDERIALHARRARRISSLIAKQPRTAYEVAQQVWGNAALTQTFLTISEVLGHVDLLLDQGEITENVDDGGVITFSKA
jgi:glyoxylase-like metal-dependent hydrolase (beta-lactamase superfamily II)